MNKNTAYLFGLVFQVLGLTSIVNPVLGRYDESGTDTTVYSYHQVKIVADHQSGKVHYHFPTGTYFRNTIAYVELEKEGVLASTDFGQHQVQTVAITDSIGTGSRIVIEHKDISTPVKLVQYIDVYENQPFIQLRLKVISTAGEPIETRYICPLAILPEQGGLGEIPGVAPRVVDVPFDNDNWVKLLAQPWHQDPDKKLEGVSHEFAVVYDTASYSGLVIASLEHDFWKTGIAYRAADEVGQLESLVIYGGAARADNPSLPPAYGGYDGTHDVVPHGTMVGDTLYSPLIYIEAAEDFRQSCINFGHQQARIAGKSSWSKATPVYWNSFGVEDVLGHRNVMMPNDVREISNFLHSLKHLNTYGEPVLSIDSYDQQIYTTQELRSIGQYGKKRNQQMGFYFIPFAIWTWRDNLEGSRLSGTNTRLSEVVLRDESGHHVPYKDDEWAAYPIDPTHPATRRFIINQIEKAKATDARFIKIDFLSAGALESATRYNPSIRTGMQAYDYGMKMVRHLIDSIMGPDIFITMAISPMFPHQYAHTRFVSTDVYSHLRDSQPGFPHYGSTAASMITASHMWWVQGTLWPYTNMDVLVMRKFQQRPDLTENEVKIRLFSLMTLGSILGDGSDYRDKLAAERAKKYLDNPAVVSYFKEPKAFTPLKFSEGETMDQQLTFYLAGAEVLLSAFNFDGEKRYEARFPMRQIGLTKGKYRVFDFLSGEEVGYIDEQDDAFVYALEPKDAALLIIRTDN